MSEQPSLSDIVAQQAQRFAESAGSRTSKISFIENKVPNSQYITSLLSVCENCNQWANRGPLYYALAEGYEAHMNLARDVAVTPCANGGIALEALARFHDIKSGHRLRWVGSAFSFVNLGRGRFFDMQFVDCDATGMLDMQALESLDPASYDGFVVTNIFGLWRDFGPYIEFARQSGKAMLIDNAAGIDETIPDWPYQSFSLHHTKPYGAGEGGFFVSPRDEAEAIYSLLNYGEFDPTSRDQWFNNGKLSDIACAYHLDRLAQYPDWAPKYREQAKRVAAIAADKGLRRMIPSDQTVAATSHPFLAPTSIPLNRLHASKRLHFGKYYKPLSPASTAVEIFDRLVNIPTHPNVISLSDAELEHEINAYVYPGCDA